MILKITVANKDSNFPTIESAVKKMMDKLEVPREWEAVEVLYFVK